MKLVRTLMVMAFLTLWSVSVSAQAVDMVKVLEAAKLIEQRNESRGGGKWFTRDCSGTMNAIFAEAGFPLANRLNKAYRTGMSGTAILHAISEEVAVREIQAGDLIFFHDTYDRNGNGISDDPFTHVGMVMKYDASSGVVDFLHYNTWMDTIITQQLNVKEPSNKELNVILRWPSKGDTQTKRYAGELVHSFGRITTYA